MKALYTYTAAEEGELTITEGEVFEMLEGGDENWMRVRSESGMIGAVPRNHMTTVM